MNKLPHVIVDARVYLENERVDGQASVQLPNLQAMTETVKGAGMMGEVEMPIIAQLQSMTCKIDWAAPCAAAIALMAPETRLITVRASVQHHDPAAGAAGTDRLAVAMRVHPKTSDFGKAEKASGSDTSVELEVLSMRVFWNDASVIHIDKTAYICSINGTDYAEKIRRDLGLE